MELRQISFVYKVDNDQVEWHTTLLPEQWFPAASNRHPVVGFQPRFMREWLGSCCIDIGMYTTPNTARSSTAPRVDPCRPT